MADLIETLIDEHKAKVMAMADAGQCEGSCEQHSGAVGAFHVSHAPSKQNWGYFAYCEAAQEEDRARGMTLTPVGDGDKGDQAASDGPSIEADIRAAAVQPPLSSKDPANIVY